MPKWLAISAATLITILAAVAFYPIAPGTAAPPSAPYSALTDPLTQQLHQALQATDTIDALVVADSNQVLFEAGRTETPINTHSVRKSLMSVLIGMAVHEGRLQTAQTLAELGINDRVMPLSSAEQQAQVADLLKARSGIYIEAAGETAEMKAARPQRGQYQPGEHYYYNNWDFNVLGAVLARATGRSVDQYMSLLAERLQFQDYQPGHLFYQPAGGSEHDQYIIYLSARDLARVGQMMLRQGRDVFDNVLISADWVRESTTPYSALSGRGNLDGYGYLWSVDSTAGTYWATGWGGQYLLVDPANDLVLVTRNNTGRRLGAFVWLVALGQSGQGQQSAVVDLHQRVLATRSQQTAPSVN